MKKIVKQKKYEYKQKLFKSLSENINQNPKEYWSILRSMKTKIEENEIPEILKDDETLKKHFQEQGKPTSNINNKFAENIESELKTLEDNLESNTETDISISCSEIKKSSRI